MSGLSSLLRAYGDRLFLLALTLWAGALWTIGFIVAPTLFEMLDDRALAGNVAGSLFSSLNWVGIVAGVYMLAHCAAIYRADVARQVSVWLIAAMLLIALAMQFGIQPLIAEMRATGDIVQDEALRERFALWHGVSSVLYVLQSVLAVVVVARARRMLA